MPTSLLHQQAGKRLKHKDMTNETNVELLPCPFCGGEAELKQKGQNEITIKCKSCLVSRTQQVLQRSIEWLRRGMIEDWNTRAALSRQGDETAQGQWLEGKFIDRNGEEYKISIQSDKTVFECVRNRLASFFVYHPSVTSRTAEQKGEGELRRRVNELYAANEGRQLTIDSLINQNDEYIRRITDLEAENKRLREGWVSVEDRLPEDCDEVFVYINIEEVSNARITAFYNPPHWYFHQQHGAPVKIDAGNVTHWRELPTPPAQTDNDKKEMV
jgi:hypothetical protein